MSLSNYDVLAATLDGTSCEGSYTAKKITVGVRKDYILISDPHVWTTDNDFVHPVVAQIRHGSINYKGVHILAMETPDRSGVCAVVWTGYGDNADGMVCCGVYGFRGEEWVGVTPDVVAWFRAKLNETVEEEFSFDMGPPHGVHSSVETVHVLDVPKAARTALDGELRRFNLGDKYFADAFGFTLPTTAPGEAEAPVLTRLCAPPAEEDL